MLSKLVFGWAMRRSVRATEGEVPEGRADVVATIPPRFFGSTMEETLYRWRILDQLLQSLPAGGRCGPRSPGETNVSDQEQFHDGRGWNGRNDAYHRAELDAVRPAQMTLRNTGSAQTVRSPAKRGYFSSSCSARQRVRD